MGESRNAYRVLFGRLEGTTPLGRKRRRWEDNKTGFEGNGICTGQGLMAGLCEGGSEPSGSLKAILQLRRTSWTHYFHEDEDDDDDDDDNDIDHVVSSTIRRLLNLTNDTNRTPLMRQLSQEIMGYVVQFLPPSFACIDYDDDDDYDGDYDGDNKNNSDDDYEDGLDDGHYDDDDNMMA
ncbi:hypothetical protein ANN_17828 [Periplaneta americana]|uniref:Uncharacterized protein n=1 Tax=Periplaneta americana TaxID=6978 RepID=A0ABQ8SU08_PERAM|nr:hypothetical protein ANN_17828 [Periplaneta americana]